MLLVGFVLPAFTVPVEHTIFSRRKPCRISVYWFWNLKLSNDFVNVIRFGTENNWLTCLGSHAGKGS